MTLICIFDLFKKNFFSEFALWAPYPIQSLMCFNLSRLQRTHSAYSLQTASRQTFKPCRFFFLVVIALSSNRNFISFLFYGIIFIRIEIFKWFLVCWIYCFFCNFLLVTLMNINTKDKNRGLKIFMVSFAKIQKYTKK